MPDETSIEAIEINPFVEADAPTYVDVMDKISADRNLPTTKKRDMLSALRRTLQLLNLDPARTPANITAIKKKMNEIHPAQAGISAKTLANLKSNIMAALRHVGITRHNRRGTKSLTPRWLILWGSIDDDQIRWKLSRLFRFCSGLNIEPENINDGTIEALLSALTEESFVKDPGATMRSTIYAWNKAQKSSNDWPQIRLTKLKAQRDTWTVPLSEFPPSLQQEIDKWVSRLRGDDPLADDAIPKPLRQATIDHRLFQVRMFASALVHRNLPKDRVADLSILADITNFKEALRFMIDRNDGQSSESIYACAMTIKSIAEHQVKVDPGDLKELQILCSRIRVRKHGLRPKNEKRLEQFDDPRNVAALLRLPDQLEASAKRRKGRIGAVEMQLAVAIELLTFCPLRISNLAALRLDETLYWSRPGRKGRLSISIPADQVKNNRAVRSEVNSELVPRIVRYLDDYRSKLFDDPGDWLFPGRGGGSKGSSNFGSQIKKTIYKHTGLKVHAHLMRHITAKLYLDQHPSSYEVVRRVLGHSSIDTTTQHYTGLESKSAIRHFDDTILRQRTDLGAQIPKRAGRRSQ